VKLVPRDQQDQQDLEGMQDHLEHLVILVHKVLLDLRERLEILDRADQREALEHLEAPDNQDLWAQWGQLVPMEYKEEQVSLVQLEHLEQLEIPVQMPHQLAQLKRVTPGYLGQPVSRVRPGHQARLDREVLLVPSVYKEHLEQREFLVTPALQDKTVLLVGQGQVVLLAQLVRLGSEEIQDSEEMQGQRVLQVSLDL